MARLARTAGERDAWVRCVADEYRAADAGFFGQVAGALDPAATIREAAIDLAREREAGTQQELNMVATVIDQSPLTDTDRAQQNWQAWLHLWQARQLRAETLGGAVATLEDELRRAEAEYQVAVLTHQPADQLAALQQRIRDLRSKLDGAPASQTARAARALRSDHRLTLTGTPVENSTLELWSQFAFLNPGMLGSLEHFRAEFAAPIEKDGDEQTAHLLRRMVGPFILRRTKDQVAPELPARDERCCTAPWSRPRRSCMRATATSTGRCCWT